MSTATGSEVAEATFNEIRYLFLHCEHNTPGCIARILHLFDKCALAEYTAQMEKVLRESTAPLRSRSTLDSSPPPSAKRTKSCHGSETAGSQAAAYREPTFATNTTSYASTSSSQIGYQAGLAVPITKPQPDDAVMKNMFDMFIKLPSSPSPPLAPQEVAQVHAEQPQPSVPTSGLPPGGLPGGLPPPTPQPQPQPQPQPRAQAQGQILYPVNRIINSVLHPDQQSDEFFVPSERAQQVKLQQADRTDEDWPYWECERLAKGVCLVPEGRISALLVKGEVDTTQDWQRIAHDIFFDSRPVEALRLQLSELKKCYTQCLAYRVFSSQAGDRALEDIAYDRTLSESALLDLIGERLDLARARGAAVGSLTERQYLKWTYDKDNGLFALMHKQFSRVPPTIPAPGTYRSPSASSSRLPNAEAAAFAVPRNSAPVIPDEDNDSVQGEMRTPTSSIDPRSSAPPSHPGHSASSSRQPSTQPTSLRSKSGIQLETGSYSLPPGYIPALTEQQHAQIQGLAALTEHQRFNALGRDLTIAAEQQATKQLQDIYELACATVERNIATCRKDREARIMFYSSLVPAQLAMVPEETRREIFAPPPNLQPAEYSELLSQELTRITRQRKELIILTQGLDVGDIDPHDSASTRD